MPKNKVWPEHKRGPCRVCGHPDTQLAHTIGASKQDVKEGNKTVIKADAVVPLCGPFANDHHGQYDGYELDLRGYLTLWEEMAALEAAGSMASAIRRLSGGRARD